MSQNQPFDCSNSSGEKREIDETKDNWNEYYSKRSKWNEDTTQGDDHQEGYTPNAASVAYDQYSYPYCANYSGNHSYYPAAIYNSYYYGMPYPNFKVAEGDAPTPASYHQQSFVPTPQVIYPIFDLNACSPAQYAYYPTYFPHTTGNNVSGMSSSAEVATEVPVLSNQATAVKYATSATQDIKEREIIKEQEKFSEKDDALLLKYVPQCKIGNEIEWGRVSDCFSNKHNSFACKQRYEHLQRQINANKVKVSSVNEEKPSRFVFPRPVKVNPPSTQKSNSNSQPPYRSSSKEARKTNRISQFMTTSEFLEPDNFTPEDLRRIIPENDYCIGYSQIGTWTPEEDVLLIKILREIDGKDFGVDYCNRKYNWESISIRMTRYGRTPIQCKNRWTLTLSPKLFGTKSGIWSPEEDKELIKAISEYCAEMKDSRENLNNLVMAYGRAPKGIRWADVAVKLGNSRTAVQCRNRWKQTVQPRLLGMKVGDWEQDEDDKLAIAVKNYYKQGRGGGVDWSRVSEELIGRTPKHCINRWNNHVKPRLIQLIQSGDPKLLNQDTTYIAGSDELNN